MRYEDVESDFLEAIASKYAFDGNTRTVFLIRFSEKDAEMNNKTLSIQYETELTLNIRERREQNKRREQNNSDQEPNAEAILRDRLKTICEKFEEQGCEYNGKTRRGRWKIAKAWLREKKFPEWVRQQQELDSPLSLWQQLWNKATSTTGITVRDTAKQNVLGIDPTAWGGKKETVPQFNSTESKLIYEINIEQAGYLILLEKSSDEIYCFSPSFLVKDYYHFAGIHIFPYKDNPSSIIHIPLEENITGIEEVIAIVSRKQPCLIWLRSETEPPFQLKKSNLEDLLTFLNQEQESKIMRSKYIITA